MNEMLPKCVKATAILETMWGASRLGVRSPSWFRISEYNMTGKRLYRFLGHRSLLVTNACGEYVQNAREHGKPDPVLLAERLRTGPMSNLLLVCGAIARQTYRECAFVPEVFATVYMPHPAFRGWTKGAIENTIRFFADEWIKGEYTLKVVRGVLEISKGS